MAFERAETRYRLLGSVAAERDGEPLALGGRGQLSLLAILLVHAGAVVSDEQLIDLLWPDSPPANARAQLQVRVSELRKVLGKETIVRRSLGYVVEVPRGGLDLARFDEAVEKAGREIAGGAGRAGAGRLREALSWWQGQPLGGVTGEVRNRFLPGIEERRAAALEQLFEAELALGGPAGIVDELRAACESYPFRENLRAQLMRALQQCGRTAEAIIEYETFRRRLDGELGIEPGAVLRDLYGRLRGGAPAAPVGPAELPYGTAGFAGRAAELAELDAGLAEQSGTGVQVWLLHGVAGVGKTALAVHWARAVRDRFADGQLYVNMRGFDGDSAPMAPAPTLDRLLGSLGIEPRRLPARPDAKAALYRSLLADKKVLLLLDNVSDAAQVLEVLPPSGTVLVTSRRRLSELVVRTGARCLQLDVLSDEDARGLLRSALGEEQVAEETEAAGALAALCGHLPLALQIAAANVRAATRPRITDLVTELASGDRLGALTLDGAEDSMVVRAFDASYHALSPELQEVFRLLAVNPGADFGAAVAAAVTDLPEAAVSRKLNALTAAHLLEQHAPGRYRFHDLVREYARGKLGAEESGKSWGRLIEFYLGTTDSAVAPLAATLQLPRDREILPARGITFTDSESISACVEAEQVNLFALLRQALERGPFPEAWYFADNVRILGHGYGIWAAWLDVAEDIAAAARRRGESRVEALVRFSVANGPLVTRAELDRAAGQLTAALHAHRADGWLEAEAATLGALGIVARRLGRLTESVGYLRHAVEIRRRLGSDRGEVAVLGNLGYVYWQAGLLAEAEEALDRAMELGRRANLRSAEGILLVSAGLVLLERGKPDDAEAAFLRARELHSALGSPYGQVFALAGASLAGSDHGDYERARERALAALELARRAEHQEAEVRALNALSRAESGLGLHEKACGHQREALACAQLTELPWLVTEASTGMCEIELAAGEADAAVGSGLSAVELATAHEFRALQARASIGVARAYRAVGQAGTAAGYLRKARILCERYEFAALARAAERL